MEPSITIKNVSKHYQLHKKEEGLAGSLKALLTRNYTTVKAVDDISFDVHAGELVGFIGSNGAGKTTTLKMLSGLLYPTSGEITILGHRPYEKKTDFLKQISFVMGQKNQLWWDIPAIESFNLNKEIYEVPEKRYREVVDELIELLDLKHVIHQQVRRLSLGERMKCELVAALLYTPKVLFLDEPTLGLDVVMQKKIREFIKMYNKKYGATVILTSHYMDDVEEICDRIIMIDHGKLMFDGAISKLVQTYADYKTLAVIFNSRVERSDVELLGDVTEFEYPRAVIRVPREKISSVAAELLQKFDIDDLNINEPELEDIIRVLFTRENK
jgi:ABC-2 type transport system ATP-binding protein